MAIIAVGVAWRVGVAMAMMVDADERGVAMAMMVDADERGVAMGGFNVFGSLGFLSGFLLGGRSARRLTT